MIELAQQLSYRYAKHFFAGQLTFCPELCYIIAGRNFYEQLTG
jgi:hypothetical protein